MLTAFIPQPNGLTQLAVGDSFDLPDEAVWIDLREPTLEEERKVEAKLGIDVPTREEMKEIEASNRLYEENGALYMTMTLAAKLDTDRPVSTAVTFILTRGRLVTARYIDTRPFKQFISYAQTHPGTGQNGISILAGIVEAIIERIADILERVGADLDALSSSIFARNGSDAPSSRDLRSMIERIGFSGDLNSKARESLVSLGRLLVFLQQANVPELTHEQRGRFRSISRDVVSLSDHSSFLGSKISFLLEATLGLIDVEQSNIIKIFSVAAVLFLPPTLIASIYGMNFKLLPNIPGEYGNFFFSIGLMIASMGITYALFKKKGWL
ncbi:MAG TPA: magnesium transporter CorA family protein [Steroidobacteraceae bacterium]